MELKVKRLMLTTIAAALLITSTASCSGGANGSTNSEKVGSQTVGTVAAPEKKTEAEQETEAKKPVVGIGEFVQGENFKITLTDAKLYDEIKSPDSEYLNEKPDDGNQYLVLFLEVENITAESQNINMFYYDSYLDDSNIDTELLLVNPDGFSMFSDDVAAGKRLKGYVAYQVPSNDWSKLEFTYKDGLASDSEEYNFVVNSDDVK